jgi:hypothetical protein
MAGILASVPHDGMLSELPDTKDASVLDFETFLIIINHVYIDYYRL